MRDLRRPVDPATGLCAEGHDDLDRAADQPGPDGYGEDAAAEMDHEWPKLAFFEDPITQAYGVGSEIVGLIRCPVCDAEDA